MPDACAQCVVVIIIILTVLDVIAGFVILVTANSIDFSWFLLSSLSQFRRLASTVDE